MSETDKPPRDKLARKLIVDLSIMTVIGVVLALIGPFGSFEQPLAYRLVAWLGFSYLGYAIYSPMSHFVDRLGGALDLPRPGLWTAAVLLATIPMTVAVIAIGRLPGGAIFPSLQAAVITYLYVLVIGGGVTALFYMLENRVHETDGGTGVAGQGAVAGDDAARGPEANRFLERLSPALGTNLIALEMEDHYVRAHTDLGSDLILLRMRDAVAELEGLEGAQVHRSWWVARSAVQGSRREGRNIRLQLDGGLEAPVSRGAAPGLKEAGWFQA
ncbi:LytTR family DNA-binding domain-containing protein [Pontixanthobacter aquaemixtae]|uniref:LytTR family transcriptional regulator n=1 Tax=Pontixanthobacter aquaemixtae TaxID=1958940 RepID=A0A844ZUZ9_9SPHN|nr:LytTR family DNA-binding domain-containing protein [Pontixanthobacter aquaemixtae]MXO91112.1 LytTR family transcriptional regulator [Pontixanthobacter aquaemixtae]